MLKGVLICSIKKIIVILNVATIFPYGNGTILDSLCLIPFPAQYSLLLKFSAPEPFI